MMVSADRDRHPLSGPCCLLYQGALRLNHAEDSQPDENLIRRCKHMEASDGGCDWGAI